MTKIKKAKKTMDAGMNRHHKNQCGSSSNKKIEIELPYDQRDSISYRETGSSMFIAARVITDRS